MRPQLEILKDPDEVAKVFAAYLVQLIANGTQCNLALSGGSTPKILFDHLASEYGGSIDWPKVQLYWGDERCVPPEHEESNYRMTVEHLISRIEIPSGNIHRVRGEDDPETEAWRYGKEIMENLPSPNGLPQFDLIILGMGPDGHTASIFPPELYLLDSLKVCEVATHPESGQKRVTLTGKVINNATRVVFLVTGTEKAEKIEEILTHSGRWKDYPAAYILPEQGELKWFVDEAAARNISDMHT